MQLIKNGFSMIGTEHLNFLAISDWIFRNTFLIIHSGYNNTDRYLDILTYTKKALIK